MSDNSQTTNPLQGDPNAAPRVRPLPLPPPQRDPGVSRPQAAALTRARALLTPAFAPVSVSFSAEEAGEAAEETGESGSKAAA